MKQAIYPGTFDPITNGHIDILKRALRIFDNVVIAVNKKSKKEMLFTIEERIEMLKEAAKGFKNIEIEAFDGLLVDYTRKKGINIIIRGLRAVSDFDFEFEMAVMNRDLDKEIETVFLMTDKNYFYLSSSLVKEIAKGSGKIDKFVPPIVCKKLKEKFINLNALL